MDFAAYKLYRALNPGVESAPDRILVTTIMDQQTTFYDDQGLEENTTYYYQLLTFDTGGLSASSNEVSGIVNANEELPMIPQLRKLSLNGLRTMSRILIIMSYIAICPPR